MNNNINDISVEWNDIKIIWEMFVYYFGNPENDPKVSEIIGEFISDGAETDYNIDEEYIEKMYKIGSGNITELLILRFENDKMDTIWSLYTEANYKLMEYIIEIYTSYISVIYYRFVNNELKEEIVIFREKAL